MRAPIVIVVDSICYVFDAALHATIRLFRTATFPFKRKVGTEIREGLMGLTATVSFDP